VRLKARAHRARCTAKRCVTRRYARVVAAIKVTGRRSHYTRAHALRTVMALSHWPHVAEQVQQQVAELVSECERTRTQVRQLVAESFHTSHNVRQQVCVPRRPG